MIHSSVSGIMTSVFYSAESTPMLKFPLTSVFRIQIAFAFSAKLELQSFLLIDLYCYRTLTFVNPGFKIRKAID